MARWSLLLLGLVLVQGYLASSPIEVSDDEWVAYFNTLRDVAYRLPTTTRPNHYQVTLTPYFETVPTGVIPFTFDGEVVIRIYATEANVNQIVLHCDDLTIQTVTVTAATNNDNIAASGQVFACEMPYAFLRIDTTTPLNQNQEYIVRSTFRGNINSGMRGFYRSWYIDSSNQKRWMGTTQFQPGHARNAFPCYDEPGFKATFDFIINRENDFSPTISNMPIMSTTQNPETGRTAEAFYTTPVTSTYLLAFIVSHYSQIATNDDQVRPFHIYARDNAGSTGDFALSIGEALLEEMEEYTQYPYYTVAANMNMKQAAIPDFSAGAMENWGLLTYREALILYDPDNSNHFYRQRVANIISHEISHMWFGNLVTCAWWDNLWLNEGFARFYTYFLTAKVAPEMGYETRFMVEQVHTAMLSDSIDTAHALTNPAVNDPTTVSAHFSTITYAKGACILRMTQYLLGVDTFVKGLRSYLQDRAFNVAEPHHLFSALDAAAAEDNALAAYDGVTIDSYFRSWSEKGGHPLLTVSVDHATGRMTLNQERWERTTGVSTITSLWDIPITWTRGGAPDFEDLKPSQIISASATGIDRGSVGREWVIFNKQQSGFYRVNYDSITWALITQALRSNQRTVIHQFNRAQIVDDVFVFARAGRMSYSEAFNILSFLEFEDEYAPWLAAITGYNFALRRLAHDEQQLQRLKNQIYDVSVAVVNRLGYNEIAGEPFMDGLLRMYVMEFLCNVGHEECVRQGVQNFQNWKNGANIPANMRPWVYCTGLRHGDAEDFDFFWNRYLNEQLANEIVVMLQTGGCTSDEPSLNRFLSAIVALDDSVRPQDYTTALSSAVNSNEVNTMRSFEWLKNNVAQTTAALGSIATPLSYITGRLLNEEDIAEVQTWLDQNQALIGSSYNTGVNGIATSRANIQWYGQRLPEFQNYFETGYVEETFEEDDDDDDNDDGDDDDDNDDGDDDDDDDDDDPTTTTTTTPAPVDDDDDDDGDGANIATLSLVTLVVTVFINMA